MTAIITSFLRIRTTTTTSSTKTQHLLYHHNHTITTTSTLKKYSSSNYFYFNTNNTNIKYITYYNYCQINGNKFNNHSTAHSIMKKISLDVNITFCTSIQIIKLKCNINKEHNSGTIPTPSHHFMIPIQQHWATTAW